MSNLSRQYISNIKRGLIVPSISKAIIIAETLGECYRNAFLSVSEKVV